MSLIELACRDKSCAPPPTGTGGSLPDQGEAFFDWSTQPTVPVSEISSDGRSGVIASGKPVIVYRGITTLDELRNGDGASWESSAQAVGSSELGTAVSHTPSQLFGDVAVSSQRRYATQLAIDVQGMSFTTLLQPEGDGTFKPTRMLGLAITEPIQFDRIVAVRQYSDQGLRLLDGDTSAQVDALRNHVTEHVGAQAVTEWLRGTGVTASAVIELACRDASCAPPPVGTGGSKPGGGAFDPKLGRTPLINQIREIYSPVHDYEETDELADAEERLAGVHTELADLFEDNESDEIEDDDIWVRLTESVQTREMVSQALKSDDPHPIAIAAMQQVHREMVAEMGDGTMEFRRKSKGDAQALDPFHPTAGKYAEPEGLRDYRSRGGTGVTSWFARGRDPYGWDSVVDWDMKSINEDDRQWMRDGTWVRHFGADQVIGRIGDMTWRGEVLIAHTPETIDRLMAGKFPIVLRENQVIASATIELACRDASCAPPPVGTGGSKPNGGRAAVAKLARERYENYEPSGEGDRQAANIGHQIHSVLVDYFDGSENNVPLWEVLTETKESREMISAALRSPNPDPIAVAVMQQAHREIEGELGEHTQMQVWRQADSLSNPYSHRSGPHGAVLRRLGAPDTGTGVTSWWGDRPKDGMKPSDDWRIVEQRRNGLLMPSDDFQDKFRRTAERGDAGQKVFTDWVGANRILGRFGDMRHSGEILVAHSPETIERLMANEFPIVPEDGGVVASLIELACRDKSCAPPPVGTGGSNPDGGGAEYRMEHTAPDRESGAAAHDLTGGNEVYPSDFWENPHYYWYNDRAIDREITDILRSVRGNPDAEVTVYRSLPPEHAEDGVNPKDWVTLSRAYAEGHGMHPDDPSQDWPVVERVVRAGDLFTAGDSLAEWGWDPENVTAAGCQSAECAPPPVGTGGSSPTTDDLDELPEGFVTDASESAERIFNFEFTDRSGTTYKSVTQVVEESDDGFVTIEGDIVVPGTDAFGGPKISVVGTFDRQIDSKEEMYHDSLSVMPEHQGKGIGSAFIAESMRRAADEGVSRVFTTAISSHWSNGVYTWLRAGFDTPNGMVTNRTTRKNLGARYRAAGDHNLASRLRGRNRVSTADLLASPVAKEALGGGHDESIAMDLQMDISDLKTEAALAASAFTDWIERAITFTLSEDETWYEPLAEEDLTAAGCQSADCAPPPTGTGGSKPGSSDMPGIVDWVSGTEMEGEIPVFDPDSDAGRAALSLLERVTGMEMPSSLLTEHPKDSWNDMIQHEESRKWLSDTVRAGAGPGEQVILRAVHENWLRRWDPKYRPDVVPIYRLVDGEESRYDPYEPNADWKASSVAPERAGTGLVSAFWGQGYAVPDGTPWGHGLKATDTSQQSTTPSWYGDVKTSDVLGVFGDMREGIGGEIIVGRPGLVQRLLRGEPSDDANAALTASADPFAGLEVYGFACHSKACAPPPVGTGGSSPGGIPGIANQEAYNEYREKTVQVQLLDAESAAYAQQQIQEAEIVVRVSTDRLSDIINYSEPEDWELRSLHDPDNEVGRSLRKDEYLQHRDLYDAAVGFDLGYVVHGYSEAEFSLEPIQAPDDPNPFEIMHRTSPRSANWYGEISLVMSDEARDNATFTITDSLNSGSVPLPIDGPIDPRAAALNGAHPYQLGNQYVEVQLRAPIELSSKHVKEIRVPDLYHLQDVAHVLSERMPDTLVTTEDDGIQMTMEDAVKALEELP